MKALRALACLVAATGLACSPAGEPDASQSAPGTAEVEAVARKVAPDFELDTLQGATIRLADLSGQIVIIDFWATWCPPCEFQVPELNAFFDAHREDGDVSVLGVSVDTDGADVVGAWAAEKDMRYPVLLAGGDDLARRYGAVGFPTLVIVAPDGSVDSLHVGLIETATLEEAVQRLRNSRQGPSSGEAPSREA